MKGDTAAALPRSGCYPLRRGPVNLEFRRCRTYAGRDRTAPGNAARAWVEDTAGAAVGAESMKDVTRILSAAKQGEAGTSEQLLPLVYDELRKLAALRLAREKPGQTLQATALVHEAYLRLVGPADDQRWENRGHFFAAAAEAMRRILVEAARRKKRIRHGGASRRVELPADATVMPIPLEDVLAVDEALEQLAVADPQAAELVKLHYFAGLTIDQAAGVLGVSERKAYSVWAYARAWLFRCLEGEPPPGT
jgi:RNA polymerase sigma factor (TIGR02999 family)